MLILFPIPLLVNHWVPYLPPFETGQIAGSGIAIGIMLGGIWRNQHVDLGIQFQRYRALYLLSAFGLVLWSVYLIRQTSALGLTLFFIILLLLGFTLGLLAARYIKGLVVPEPQRSR